MNRCFGALGLAIAWSLGLASGPTPAQDKDAPIKVLFILNGHDPLPKAPILEKVLKEAGGFQVTRLEKLPQLADVKRADYDVLLFYGGPQANEIQERALEKFLEEGGGIVALHHASAHNSKVWIRLIGGRFAGHIAGLHKMQVVLTEVKHPVTAGLEPFEVVDEEYKHTFAEVERTVLGRFKERPAGSDPKANNDIIWVREVGKGRVFYTGLGHGKECWESPAWQKLVLQAICWSAGKPREVKLAPPSK
jgi:type 1 glutamine amidotransferase